MRNEPYFVFTIFRHKRWSKLSSNKSKDLHCAGLNRLCYPKYRVKSNLSSPLRLSQASVRARATEFEELPPNRPFSVSVAILAQYTQKTKI